MATALDYLGLVLFLCAIPVFCIGAYHQFMLMDGWRREWKDGHGRWGYLNYNIIPEPYRTHRRRSNQMRALFLVLLALFVMVSYLKGTLRGLQY
jgi:hypothetical protein